ncbi:MAG: hypothetical protein Kow0031_41730 [Anaerolineae bacterium]
MRTIKIKPVCVTGKCRAGLRLEDEVQIRGVNLENPGQSRVCCHAFSHFSPVISTLQHGDHFYAVATCPDCQCNGPRGARVDFLLGHADKWELCQAIVAYRQLRERVPEPAAARQLRAAAVEHQKRGEFVEAAEKMYAALAVMEEMVTAR